MPDSSRYGVLGHPIEHSLSPQIHRSFAEEFGISISYDRFDVPAADFSAFWFGGPGDQLAGANVTMPLKELAFELVDEVDDSASEVGAVNTIVRRDRVLVGYNTDGAGLVTDLTTNLRLKVQGKRLLLIGAGGAARGILPSLLKQAPAELIIANRTLPKAAALLEQFRGSGALCISALSELDQTGQFDGVINATSLGYTENVVKLPATLLGEMSWAYNLSYGDAARPFLHWAQSTGASKIHDGLGMLIEQAAESFRIWHGVSPTTKDVSKQFGAKNRQD